MIENPEDYIKPFQKAGSDYLTIHYEAIRDPELIRKKIQKAGMKTGISLKPGTKLTKRVLEKMCRFDLILIMTVEPGFGGQSFMKNMVEKIETLRPIYSGLISVDGGINGRISSVVKRAGVDVLVAGSYIFNHQNRKQAIQSLKK